MRPWGGEATCVPERIDKNVDFEGPRTDHFCVGPAADGDGRVKLRPGKRTVADGAAVCLNEAFFI